MPQRSTAYPERRGRRVGEEPVAGRWNLALQLELVSMLIISTLSGVGVARSRSLPPTAGRVARLWLYAHRGRRRRWRRLAGHDDSESCRADRSPRPISTAPRNTFTTRPRTSCRETTISVSPAGQCLADHRVGDAPAPAPRLSLASWFGLAAVTRRDQSLRADVRDPRRWCSP